MTFYEYIQKFNEVDAPIGDLAYGIKKDEMFPTLSEEPVEIKNYLFSKTNDNTILDVMGHAIESYKILKCDL